MVKQKIPTKIVCCGNLLTTDFCPHCGRKGISSLSGLLKHIRDCQKRAETFMDGAIGSNMPEPGKKRHINRCTINFLRWKKWGDALESLMGENDVST